LASSPPNKAAGLSGNLKRWLASSEGSVVFVIAALWIYMATTSYFPRFASPDNLGNLGRAIGFQSITATGELLVILTGGIDLSVGSQLGFDGMLMARVMTDLADRGVPIPQATAAGIGAVLVFSLLLGLLHASLIHYLRLPPFVVTLGSMSILRSAAQLLNNAVPIPIDRFETVRFLGNEKLYISGTHIGIPVPTLVMVVLAGIISAILMGTRLGRQVYAVGSNEEASRLSGVNVFKVLVFVYCGCSLLTGITAILYAGYGGQGNPTQGEMAELNAISAAVIGGALLTGGRGSVAGAILGAALLQCLLSVINFVLHNPSMWSGTVVGTVLVAAVVLNQLRQMPLFRRFGKTGPGSG